ncbi:MAG TPA: alpha/beta hydrolase [Caulobacteraceae bacterium]|nr:alpha/beta hydrolase [Caulobacteraceae bacterium]
MTAGSAEDITEVSIPVTSRGQPLTIAGWSTEPTGRAPDVIWLHANGFNARTYRHALAPLAGRLAVLAIDQRGHGATPQASAIEDKRDALDMRDDLLGLLNVVSVGRPVILAGHSMGGCVSLLAAAEAPQRVRGIGLFDPVILSPDVAERAMAANGAAASESGLVGKARSRRRHFGSYDEVLETYRRRSIFATWPEPALRDYIAAGFAPAPGGGVELTCAPEWEAANFAAHGHDIWAAMARVEAPVRILRAEHGSTCAIAEAAAFPRPAGQVEVATIMGATHFLPIERPELVRETLLALAAATQA